MSPLGRNKEFRLGRGSGGRERTMAPGVIWSWPPRGCWFCFGDDPGRSCCGSLQSFGKGLHLEILAAKPEHERPIQSFLDRDDVFFTDRHGLVRRELVPGGLIGESEVVADNSRLLS